MKTKIASLLVVIAVLGASMGCTPRAEVQDGVYHGNYSRADGSVLVQVRANTVHVIVDDSDGGFYQGSKQVTRGTNSVSATNGTQTVNVNVSFSGAGNERIATGNVTGPISLNFNAVLIGSGVDNVFAGNFSGNLVGDLTASFTATVSGSGEIELTAVDAGMTEYALAGTVSGVGATALAPVAGGNAVDINLQMTGFAHFGAGTLARLTGTWQSSSGSGTWSGTRSFSR